MFAHFDKLNANGIIHSFFPFVPDAPPVRPDAFGKLSSKRCAQFCTDCSNPVRPDASVNSAVNAALSSTRIVPIPFVLSLSKDTNENTIFY
ncbi:MAG TPA: hypothetical protein VKR54_03860 [Candidatus Babeliales bacterium]|nr:hypothetical protein [Candidatus Babeliales bacterium]